MTDIGKINIKNWIDESSMFDEYARDYVKNLIDKDIIFELKDYDKETLTGICKCGRVTAKVYGEFYCKYCGQKLIGAIHS